MGKHKKFIKECYEGKHGTMCENWKATILKHYPEFEEEKFKIGDWLWPEFASYPRPHRINYITKTHYKTDPWTDSNPDAIGLNKSRDYRKATDKEVEEHLIKEAERRYKVPCPIQYLDSDINVLQGYSLNYDPENDTLGASGFGAGDFIYQKGQWAEIISTITKEEAEKKLNCKIV